MRIPEHTSWDHGEYWKEKPISLPQVNDTILKHIRYSVTSCKGLCTRYNLASPVLFRVRTRSDCYVQCMGSHISVHSPHWLAQVRVPKGPLDRDSRPFLACPRILLHGKVRRSRVDDNARFLLGLEQWISHCLCYDSSTQRLQGLSWTSSLVLKLRLFYHNFYLRFKMGWAAFSGTRAKCLGQLACAFSLGWDIFGSFFGLAVDHTPRQVLVSSTVVGSYCPIRRYWKGDNKPHFAFSSNEKARRFYN